MANFAFSLSNANWAIILLVQCLVHCICSSQAPPPSLIKEDIPKNGLLRFDGEVNIGVLVNLHHPSSSLLNSNLEGANSVSNEPNHSSSSKSNCGLINVDAVQKVLAAKWAVDVINNQSLPHELKIGLQLHDTCSEEEQIQNHLYHVIASTRDPASPSTANTKILPPILGMIGVGGDSLPASSGALHAFNIPLISASPNHADSLLHDGSTLEDNVLTTAPDMSGQARALASIANELNVQTISVISSSHRIIQTFLSEATALGISVPKILELSHRQLDIPEQVEQFIQHMHQGSPAIALIVDAREAIAIAEYLKHVNLNSKPLWLIGSLGLDLKKLTGWRRVFQGGVFVEPHMPELKEFKEYFMNALQDSSHSMKDLIQEYKEEMFGCTRQPSPMAGQFLVPCDQIPEHEIELRFVQDPHVSFVVKAVSALTAAFRLVQLDHCAGNVKASCLREVHENLHTDILGNIKKLSFNMMAKGTPLEVEGTQHHFTRNGKLITNKQILYIIDAHNGLETIGWYSEDEGIHMSTALHFKSSTTELPYSSPFVNDDRSHFARSIEENEYGSENLDTKAPVTMSTRTLETLPIFSYQSFISRTWTLVVLAVAIFGTVVALFMVVYVFQKMCDGTLNGNQTMGVLLLFGVMGLFASVIPWLLPPNEQICAVRHFMHPLLLTLCFAILLVKAMQLRSLVTIGLGGTIPQVNQLVSLFFMIVVQVVIQVEWYATNKPIGVLMTNGYPECAVSKSRFMLLHVYPTALLLLSFFYGISVLKVKRNFNEGRWITCASIFIIPIFAAWPLVYYFAPVQFHDPSVSVSVLAVGGILMAAIFFPKMHTIAHQKKLKSSDLSRTHSDATVYTGFSDYLPFVAPSTGSPHKGPHPGLYPVYGYTTNQFVTPLSSSAASTMQKRSKKSPQKYATGPFNYVPTSNAPHVKSYADWSRDFNPTMVTASHRPRMQSNDNLIIRQSVGANEHTVYSLPRSRPLHRDSRSQSSQQPLSVSQTHLQRSTHHLEEDNQFNVYSQDQVTPASQKLVKASKKKRARHNSANSGTSSHHYYHLKHPEPASPRGRHKSPPAPTNLITRRRSRSHSSASRFVDYPSSVTNIALYRQRHSHSPSDGMILTAEGLVTPDPGHRGSSQRASPEKGFQVSEVYLTH